MEGVAVLYNNGRDGWCYVSQCWIRWYVQFWQFSSSPTLTNVSFSRNGAGEGAGGAMVNSGLSSPHSNQRQLYRNGAHFSGGAMSMVVQASATLTNVSFSKNSSSDVGLWCYRASSGSGNLTLTNVSFSENRWFFSMVVLCAIMVQAASL